MLALLVERNSAWFQIKHLVNKCNKFVNRMVFVFLSVHFVFEKQHSGLLLIYDDCVGTMNHASQFDFHHFSSYDVYLSLYNWSIDSRILTGSRIIWILFFPIITKQLTNIFNLFYLNRQIFSCLEKSMWFLYLKVVKEMI